MENKKQTVVEFLQEQLKKMDYNPLQMNGYAIGEEMLFEQAKKMFEEQIIEAYCNGDDNIGAKQYYNETYGKEG